MVQSMKDDLERLHETLIEILEYIISVCEENGLRYYLIYGSALGAYRHKGFIPWDDDLDIGMPRDDYEKFIQIMKDKNSDMYAIQNEDNEKKYYHPFSKVRKSGTTFIESISKNMYTNNGIYVDIFPLDYVKEKNSFTYKIRTYLITYLKHSIRYAAYKGSYDGKRGVVGHILEHILCFPAFILPKKMLLHWLNSLCKGKCTEDKAKYIAQYYDKRYRMTMPIEFILPGKKISFCGKEVNVPNQIEDYLTRAYGSDYMQLPPVEQRRTHMPVELKFE